MGSLTISGALELQVMLRTFDLFGICLVVLWVLSPLGGLASLRLLDSSSSQSTSNIERLFYLNPDSKSSLLDNAADDFHQSDFLPNALYLSALLAPPAGQSESIDT